MTEPASAVPPETEAPETEPAATEAQPEDYASIADAASRKEYALLDLVTTDVTDYPTVRLYFRIEDVWHNTVVLSSPTAGIVERIEDGTEIEREIRSIEQLDENLGIGLDLLVDTSGSMEPVFPQMLSTLKGFIRSMDYSIGDSAEIISFDDTVMYMCSFTNNLDYLLTGVSNMSPNGMTSLYDALYTGVTRAAGRKGPNCVIAFTDGRDNNSAHTYNEVLRFAREKKIPIYLIGSGDVDRDSLEHLAAETGGQYWSIDDISDVGQVMREVYRVQKEMYCVEYESDPDTDRYQYAERSIRCAVLDDTYGGRTSESFVPRKTVETANHASRYEIIAADVSWSEANEQCLQRGGHLVTVTSAAENQLIISMAEEAGLKYIWIGGYTSKRNGQIYGHWITGEDFEDFQFWGANQPSWVDLDGTPEYYIMLWYVREAWSWNDERNDVIGNAEIASAFTGRMGFVCEYEDYDGE